VIREDAPDRGAWLTLEGLPSLGTDDGDPGSPSLLVTVGPGRSGRSALARLEASATQVERGWVRSSDVDNFAQLTALPWAIAAFAAMLGVGSLAHSLLVTSRTRRRDHAVLRSIGFTAHQVGACITWQALAVAAFGAIVGLPVGVLAGRASWAALARSIGAADDALVPPALLLLAPIALLVAAVVAALPAAAARRSSPAAALRAD
jgi:predicted lysophospholipase L1 biosynthesis ABC-type transport system permease subunit